MTRALTFVALCLFAAARVAAQTQTGADEEVRRLGQQVVGLYGQGKVDEALPLARRAVELAEKSLAPGHELTSVALANLANLHVTKGELPKAEGAFERILAARERAESASSAQVSKSLNTFMCVLAARLGPDGSKKALEKFRRVNAVIQADSLAARRPAAPVAKGELTGGRERHRAGVKYSKEAAEAGASGAIVVRVEVDESGRVVGAKALDCTHPLLKAAAEEAARATAYEPFRLGGEAVGVETLMLYHVALSVSPR